MKISFLYIYKKNCELLAKLVEYCKINPESELIILNDNDQITNSLIETCLKIKNYKNINFYSFPRVSSPYLYNQGIFLSKTNIIAIIKHPFLLEKNIFSEIFNIFSKQKNIFLLVEKYNNFLLKKSYIYFSKKFNLKKMLLYCNQNFFLNKKIIFTDGLFLDENIDDIGILDLNIRLKKNNYIAKKIKLPQSKIDLPLLKYILFGKYLLIFFNKYKLSKKNIFLFFQITFLPLESLITLLSFLIFGLKRFFYFKTIALLRKLNRKWINFCKKYSISQPIFFPSDLSIEPTNICNAKCPLCPTGSGQLKRIKGYMDFTLFKKIIDESKYFIENILLWNLGEPFLNKNIYSMIQYAKKFCINVISSSNGTAIKNKYMVNRLLESGIDKLILSLDGIDEKTFNTYRIGVDFKSVIKGLYLTRDKKISNSHYSTAIEFQFILMKHNYHQAKDIYKLSLEMHASFMVKYLNLEMVQGKNKKSYLPEKNNFSAYRLFRSKPILKHKKTNKPCPIWSGIIINWDGSINPCIFDYYSRIILGNAEKESIIKVWRKSKLIKLRKKILINKKSNYICRHCVINETYSELYLPR